MRLKKTRTRVHILVVPDLHLELGDYDAVSLIETLKKLHCDVMIVAGDLHLKNCKLSQEALKIITYLRQAAEEVVFVRGNHDPAPGNWFWKKVVGAKPVRKFVWEAGGKRLCVMHGHRFDRIYFLFNARWLDKMLSGLVWLVNCLDPGKNHLAWLIDWAHTRFSNRIAKRARRYAARRGIDVVICAHTHKALKRRYRPKKGCAEIVYINCGNREGNQCSFAIIDERGNVKLCRAEAEMVSK